MPGIKNQRIKNVPSLLGPVTFPNSHAEVYSRLESWLARFPGHEDPSIFKDLELFFLTATYNFLDLRNPIHLFRLVLAIHLMQKKLFHTTALSKKRQIEIKWISTSLLFPFFSKSVLGCLVGVNLLDRYDLFDEENIHLILRKNLPDLVVVKESAYHHPYSKNNHKILYFEIEKSDGSVFSLKEQIHLKGILEEKIKNSIQRLTPSVFMQRNEEEVCKNILTLSQEIHKADDLPQAVISLEQQTAGEIVFLITLVSVAAPEGFSFKHYFSDHCFVFERQAPVKYLQEHLIEAQIFRIHLDRQPALLRSDGSLDFYLARQKAVSLIRFARGPFRDFNGGILIKQQELLQHLKEKFVDVDREFLETFFYSITPLEKQVSLPQEILSKLFSHFLDIRKSKMTGRFIFNHNQEEDLTFLNLRFNDLSLRDVVLEFMKLHTLKEHDLTFNIIQLRDEFFFQCVGMHSHDHQMESFVALFKDMLAEWEEIIMSQKILRIGFEYSVLSLDPRIGGESISQVMAGLLFEGLTRYDKDQQIELAIAETITISSDGLEYTFKLQPSCWNDRSPLTAYDFEYAWKKVLSPDFQTSFAYLFYPIRGAKEAKEGKISLDEVGIQVVDERTLKVFLNHPAPYFLELTSHQIYSPIHRYIDQLTPQWPNQSGINFPCNGAFSIEVNHPGLSYKLIKNRHFWAPDDIALDEIVFNKMNSVQALQAFRRGEIDWLGHPLGSWMESYLPAEDDKIITFPNGSVCWQIFNTSKTPFHNSKLRQAISYAIDRSEFCSTASISLTPAYSILLPQHTHNPEVRFPSPNHEIARKLWQEGWDELGVKQDQIPTLSFIYYYKGVRGHVVARLRKQMKEVLGVECKLEPLPWKTLFERITKGDFQIGLTHWTSWINDPIYTLNSFRFKKEDMNVTKWENPLYQELLEKSDHEVNPPKRFSYFAQAEEILTREIPLIPLFYQPFQAMLKKKWNVTYNISRAVFNLAKCFYKK